MLRSNRTRVRHNLWNVIEEEYWDMDPALLYSIFEHKTDVANKIVELKGQNLEKEPHAGAHEGRGWFGACDTN